MTTAKAVHAMNPEERYQEWRKLLHHFYKPFPVVEHYQAPIAL